MIWDTVALITAPRESSQYWFTDCFDWITHSPICPSTWWRHQMVTFSALLAFVQGIHRSPGNSPHNDQWRGALMFSLICDWTNDWANNRGANDLRRRRTHYDGIVMNNLPNPTMHLCHIPQCTIQNRNVYISVLNGALWDIEQVHCDICEFCLLNTLCEIVLRLQPNFKLKMKMGIITK